MGPDMKPLPSLSPRGGLLSTGEDTAARGSAKGRSLLVSVTRGETPTTNSVAHATLTPLQADAAAGAYARTMAAYIQHVASRGLDHQLDRLKQLTTEFRDQAMREEVHGHARTPGILADLAAGYRLFLEWAGTVIADLDPTAASEEHWKWLCTLAPRPGRTAGGGGRRPPVAGPGTLGINRWESLYRRAHRGSTDLPPGGMRLERNYLAGEE